MIPRNANLTKKLTDTVHERIKGVITRKLQKVGQATRSQLRAAQDGKSGDRQAFDDGVFDSLVTEGYLVAVDENTRPIRYRLADPEGEL